jgi:hypothetical protein
VFYPDGTWNVYRWSIGAPFGDTLYANGSVPAVNGGFFFLAPVELKGRILGAASVGSSENIRLIDDIWYVSSQNGTGSIDTNSIRDMLGIISEGSVLIGNTPENGRENRTMGGADIIINAGIVALGESFTFEDQNDVWNQYQGPYPDERGIIRLWGSVVQRRRGYVHRSNHNGSGYGKQYHFDTRFYTFQPPCYPDATDEMGHSLFDVIAWGTLEE